MDILEWSPQTKKKFSPVRTYILVAFYLLNLAYLVPKILISAEINVARKLSPENFEILFLIKKDFKLMINDSDFKSGFYALWFDLSLLPNHHRLDQRQAA